VTLCSQCVPPTAASSAILRYGLDMIPSNSPRGQRDKESNVGRNFRFEFENRWEVARDV
jgi:hypothetical protein